MSCGSHVGQVGHADAVYMVNVGQVVSSYGVYECMGIILIFTFVVE